MPFSVGGSFVLDEVVEDPVCLHGSMRSILGEADEVNGRVCVDAEVLDEHMPEALEVTFSA